MIDLGQEVAFFYKYFENKVTKLLVVYNKTNCNDAIYFYPKNTMNNKKCPERTLSKL